MTKPCLPIAPAAPARPDRCWGLLTYRPRWGLSVRGAVLAALLLAAGVAAGLRWSYPFFAITDRAPAELLVVEGWINDHCIRAAAAEYRSGGYTRVFTTGGPVEGMGGYVNDYSTAASIGATRLCEAGVPADQVQMVPSRTRERDRTFSSAVALREWFRAQGIAPRAINVVTADVHARRTRLLFQLAFGSEVRVGVVAIPAIDYDARHWWRYSDGVRDLLGECIAYAYASLYFSPSVTLAGTPPRSAGAASSRPSPPS